MAKKQADAVDLKGNAQAGEQLKAIIERVERVNEDIAAYNDDKKEIFAEAKAAGFDNAAIKQLIKLRKTPAEERAEASSILELYAHAIGFSL